MLKRDDGAELLAVVKDEQPDITILQEHKLQDVHVPKHEPSVLRIFDEACPGKRPYRVPLGPFRHSVKAIRAPAQSTTAMREEASLVSPLEESTRWTNPKAEAFV